MKILITGSSGLIGGEAVQYFDSIGHVVIGVDNNMRKDFFGEAGDTEWNLHRIYHTAKNFTHSNTDIRDYHALQKYVFDEHGPFDAIIHCAAQPSHDKAKDFPILDFEVNALGTLNLLELTRLTSPNAVFIFMSTNKVYGDAPNEVPLIELDTRFEYASSDDFNGISESFRIDQSTHSVFGASKVAADIMVQEYGRYFNLKTSVLRGGCLTGPSHSGVELHGFLSYLVKCVVSEKPYKVFGYKGLQVRDNIHSYDVVRAMEEIINNPKYGEVYNIGGGRENSVSMLEAIALAEKITGKKLNWEYVNENRIGDHMCYITDLTKIKRDYPNWKITKSIEQIFFEIISSENLNHSTERFMPGDGGDEYFMSYAKFVVPKAKGHVLDIGCGHGFLTKKVAMESAAFSIVGTDYAEVYRLPDSKITYLLCDTSELINSTSPIIYDTIISTEHIEHIDGNLHDPLLRWIKSHISEGGVFLGSMPNPDDPNNLCAFHICTYSMKDWEVLLNKHFNKVEIIKTSEKGYSWAAYV